MAVDRLLLTLPETAEATRLSLRKIKYLVADGTIPSIKLGGRRLVPTAGLNEMLNRAVSGGGPDGMDGGPGTAVAGHSPPPAA